ncbi:MAG: chitobiase/beta-hexosaminidase C-terminal domain-containing protein [Cyclonatronaceae bacterium]
MKPKKVSVLLITGIAALVLLLTLIQGVDAQNPFKAPLYWSVYENHILQSDNSSNYITEADLSANIDWVEENLLPYGYDMIAIDGWGDVSQFNENGYRTSHSVHWQNDFAWWAQELQGRGMNLGMYDNPLWVNMSAVNAGHKIAGTDIPLENIINRNEQSLWFTWVQVDREGAEEYVRGNIRHWASMGIRFLNADFLSWFEDGYDKNLGVVGPQNRPHEHYVTAMRWMKEEADANNMLFKAVMPHLKNEAEVELQYSHMIRINEDVGSGGWYRFSQDDRSNRRPWWSQWANPFDGYTYWSYLTGRNGLILCGDFIRLNTFESVEEKKSVISLHLMAGGPLGVSDQYNTIGNDLWLYQNEEMLALNADGFVGKPLTNDPTDAASQIWTGLMSDGDTIVALFNRESSPRTRTIDFSQHLGIEGQATVRDLWQHSYIGTMDSYSVVVPPRGVVVLRIAEADPGISAAPVFDPPAGTYSSAQSVTITTATEDAVIYYTTDGTDPDASSAAYTGPVDVAVSITLKAIAMKSGLENSDINTADYVISPLPQGWQNTDIGNVSPAGSAAWSSDTFTLEGSGADIEGTADAFHYVYQSVEGDVLLTARLESLGDTDPWAKAGLMVRQTLEPGSANVMMGVTPGNGAIFQNRSSAGSGTLASVMPGISMPIWLAIRRDGNTFSGFVSPDGASGSWTQAGSDIQVGMGTEVYVGLAVTSHNNGVLTSATFSDVSTDRTLTDIIDDDPERQSVKEFALAQNYPNPFNPSTLINFSLETSSHTTLIVYDQLGRRVATLIDGHLTAGAHSSIFEADTSLATALYFYVLTSGSRQTVKKMLLLK